LQILYPSSLHPTNSAGPSQDPCGRDDEDLAKVAVEAIESWLDEDIVGFEQDEG